MLEGDPPTFEIALTHFIVSDDVERSRRFYTEALGGKTVRSGEPSFVAPANSWIITSVAAPPTTSQRLRSRHRTIRTGPAASSTARVSDIQAAYSEWSARGAEFLTPPKEHENEIRCYMRDPDGHLIEVGQITLDGNWRQFLIDS